MSTLVDSTLFSLQILHSLCVILSRDIFLRLCQSLSCSQVEEDGTETLVSDTDTRHVDTLGGELSFRPVTIGDQSTYKCVATNAAGEAESEGYLDVQGMVYFYDKLL